MPLALAQLQPLLGAEPDSPAITETLQRLKTGSQDADVKTYPDATYHNYYALGLSLCFVPGSGSSSSLSLDSIDIFSPSPTPPRANKKDTTYAAPPLPLTLEFAEAEVVLPPRKAGEKEIRYPRDKTLSITATTPGREIVRALGEPSRKGSGGWVGVWLEWGRVSLLCDSNPVDVGIMLELKERTVENPTDEQRKQGMGGVWDRAANWPWSSVKLFRPSPSSKP